MSLFDIHSHLLSREFFTIVESDDIIKQCAKENIIIIESLLEPEKYKENLKIIEKYDNVFATLGFLEPEAEPERVEKVIKFMQESIMHHKVVGIGEIGMDFFKGTNREKQEKNFRQLLNFVKTTNLPVVIHSRSASKYCFKILNEVGIKKVIFHCYDGGIKLAKKIVERGWVISISTNIYYNEMTQRYIKEIPIENIVLETDSPFLHPLQKKERKNTPLNLKFSIEKINEITGKSKEEIAEITSKNAKDVFKL